MLLNDFVVLLEGWRASRRAGGHKLTAQTALTMIAVRPFVNDRPIDVIAASAFELHWNRIEILLRN